MKRLFIMLLFICPSAFAAYTTMTIEGVQQANGVWTAAGVMDTQGFVRKTGQVSVMGQTRNLPVALAADTAAAGTLLKGAARLAGPIALAAAAYEVYEWYTSDNLNSCETSWCLDGALLTPISNGDCTISTSPNVKLYNTDFGSCMSSSLSYYPCPADYTCDFKYKGTFSGNYHYDRLRKKNTTGATENKVIVFAPASPGLTTLPPTESDFNKMPQPTIPLLISGWTNLPNLSTQPTPIKSSDFTPFSDWMGEPYFKDGNWYRDRMDVSPAPTTSQPNRIRVDIGPVKLDGMTDPNVKPEETPASSSTAPKEQTKFCDDNPNSIACQEMGELEPEPIVPDEKQFQLDTSQSWGASNGSCPSSPSVTLHTGKVITFNYQPTCNFLAILRPIIIAFALLGAVLIAIGRVD